MSHYPFDNLSDHAKRALVCARQEAEDANDTHIGTEHLLLGLFRVGAGSAWRALRAVDVDEIKVRRDIEDARVRVRRLNEPLATKGAQQALVAAYEASARRGDGTVRTGDLLRGILQVTDATAAIVLRKNWIEAKDLEAAIEREINRE